MEYRLETFTESRSTEWASKPHEGEPVDFYTQPAPRPWEVQATPPNFFTDHKEEIRVPYTSSIQDCNMCRASGALPCDECHGSGDKDCRACNGAGMSDTGNCHHCNGTGKEKCKVCNGRRTKKCPTCKGKRQLLTFIKVKVEWVNHVEDHVVEQNSGLKIKDLRLVSGKELIKNNQYLLYPLFGFPYPAISEASERMVKEHQSMYSQTSRILQQAESGADPHHQGELQVERRHSRVLCLRQREPSQCRQLPGNLLLRRSVDARLSHHYFVVFKQGPSMVHFSSCFYNFSLKNIQVYIFST
ncbi:protein SSUH2 homolog isoform 4-T4 [Pholidichthys leucotaenia]